MANLLAGVFPILATCFHDNDEIDYESQQQLIEFCIKGGVHGLVLCANASEGHLLSDQEKRDLIAFCLRQIDGRVPVIVTVNHPSAKVSAELAQFAEAHGAAAVMSMPPFFGRWRAGLDEISRYFGLLNDAVQIPIVVQDHVLSDIQMPVSFLVDLARKYPRVRYMKMEAGNINFKTKQLLQVENQPFLGIFGGNSGCFMPEEIESGCTGTMPACYMPEVFRKTWDMVQEGREEEAVAYFTPFSRLAAYEKDVANRCVWKEILVARGVIAGHAVRQPKPSFASDWQLNQLLKVAQRAGLISV
ncbi:dihydrodipicolinate synthase family protein [Paenibacillus cremeus]|uniref:Dihydrodipicolinate synthase family protein n=1 Tax=Paenibacillus cremeus TaxID=2163881 RepID=A0A559KAW5_9BACL|nr:dihydrodipicolinate synthase family protein [Paenibacillus cremeus]TVY09243.1 dihydrodipicolinate synthase family protein [Paenibacillus cremeus]